MKDFLQKVNSYIKEAFSAGKYLYDGLSVKTYNYEDGLPNSFINEIFEDSDGNLWIAFGQKGIIKWRNGKVINHYTTNNGLESNITQQTKRQVKKLFHIRLL